MQLENSFEKKKISKKNIIFFLYVFKYLGVF